MSAFQAVCEQCGNEYLAHRKTSRFCSSNCRVAAYRQEHQPEGEAAPELRMNTGKFSSTRSMRIRIRPLDVEVEWTMQNGHSFKQWWDFESHPRLEKLYNHGTWEFDGIRYLLSTRDVNG